MRSLGNDVLNALRTAIGPGPYGLHEPTFAGNESVNLQECIASTFVSSVGPFVDRFEHEIAEYTGSRFAVATVNGTAALHVALLLAGVEPDDEVLVPSLSFVATANAVRYSGAVPHFVDSSTGNAGMDPGALRDWLVSTSENHSGFIRNRFTGRRIRAVVPMHAFGHPCDLDPLLAIGREFNLAIVEDAAESLGSWYHGQHTGTFGLLGILSFNGNKTITTGGGGAILTDNPELARRAKHLTTTAKVPHRWGFVHDEVGFNYRMPNMNAALGCAQLEQLTGFLDSKRRLFERYRESFGVIAGTHILAEPRGCQSNYWLQTLLLDTDVDKERDSILTITNDAGFMTRPTWTLLHQLLPYQNCPRAPVPVAEDLERRIINLPSSAGLA